MNLFERLSGVIKEELTSLVNQSIRQEDTPEEEIERTISQMRSKVMATRIAIVRSSASQARLLKKGLVILEEELAQAEAKREALLRRISQANQRLERATRPTQTPFYKLEEKALELEAIAQAADELNWTKKINS
ncbi:hypothetical protein MC7420_1496 [Coleofasciculus chthonoplastes PCC 7420]|uniref:PspA/IM30 family n=1 Tax=Coleofasciculus chthonoplastes PCC 7420 TaxID=118168 RepID=B4VRA7_9CYAN|nr:hypothetical protein [Coleofasciculus chthonoplastes]EDX75578.1 hypothetical protein MC7420_1496 [Coleofasciculus chthonoplastes PCC 7420]